MSGKKRVEEDSIDDLVKYIEGPASSGVGKRKAKQGKGKRNAECVSNSSFCAPVGQSATRSSPWTPEDSADAEHAAGGVTDAQIAAMRERIRSEARQYYNSAESGYRDGRAHVSSFGTGSDDADGWNDAEVELASFVAAEMDKAAQNTVDGAVGKPPLPPKLDVADIMRRVEEKMTTAFPEVIAAAVRASMGKHNLDHLVSDIQPLATASCEHEEDDFGEESDVEDVPDEEANETSLAAGYSTDGLVGLHEAIRNFEKRLAAFRVGTDPHHPGWTELADWMNAPSIAASSQMLAPPCPSASSMATGPSRTQKAVAVKEQPLHESQAAAALAIVEAEQARIDKMLRGLQARFPSLKADMTAAKWGPPEHDPQEPSLSAHERINKILESVNSKYAADENECTEAPPACGQSRRGPAAGPFAGGDYSAVPLSHPHNGGANLTPGVVSEAVNEDGATKARKKKKKKKKATDCNKDETDEDDFDVPYGSAPHIGLRPPHMSISQDDYDYDDEYGSTSHLGPRPPFMSVSQVTAAHIARPAAKRPGGGYPPYIGRR